MPKTSSTSCDLGTFFDDAAKAIKPTDHRLVLPFEPGCG
jgi:hypothetical protein